MTREEMLLWFFASYGIARFLLDLSRMVDWWVKKIKEKGYWDMKEDYCSYETAKLLKEKGFAEPCQAYWRDFENGDRVNRVNTTFAPNENHNKAKGFISMPTHQMAMKWLRENKGLFINIGQSKCMNAPIKYRFSIWKDVTYIGKSGDTGDYSTYEEAVEAALKHCLTKLIKDN